jgi:hypothetical protein
MDIPEQPRASGDTVLSAHISRARDLVRAMEDRERSIGLQIIIENCVGRATQLLEAAAAEGTALTVLPELVTRGSATAMPLAAFDELVHDGLLAIGDTNETVRLALIALKNAAREAVTLEIDASRQRIDRLGGPEVALRQLTRAMLGRN